MSATTIYLKQCKTIRTMQQHWSQVQLVIRHSEVEYTASVIEYDVPIRRTSSHDESAYGCFTVKGPWKSESQKTRTPIAKSSETKSVHYMNDTIDRDIRPSKRLEFAISGRVSDQNREGSVHGLRALPVRNGLIRYIDYLLCCLHSVYSLDEHFSHSSVWHT